MLTKRIIPCLDVNNGKVLKGTRFQKLNTIGNPVNLAEMYYKQGADELVFLDIGASPQQRKTLFKIVKKIPLSIV